MKKCKNSWCGKTFPEDMGSDYCPKCDDLMMDAMIEKIEGEKDEN